MKYEKIDNQLFIEHRKKLKSFLLEDSMVILCANREMHRNGDQKYPFHQHADFFYLCGIDQPNSILVLSPQHSNVHMREVLFIPKTTEKERVWGGEKLSIEEAKNISGIETIRFVEDFEQTLSMLVEKSKYIYVDIFEKNLLKDSNYELLEYLKNVYPLHEYRRLLPIMEQMRLHKTEKELQLLQKACEITAQTFCEDILPNVKPNKAECAIEGEIISGFLSRRATGHSFHPIVASGKNACILHYNQNNDVCKNGDLLLIDIGAEYANYAGDLSRTIPVNGKFSPRQKQLYQLCERVFNFAKTCYIPGMSINKTHALVLEKMQEELLEIGLIKSQDIRNEKEKYATLRQYFMHGLAHFVGLDVHDVGDKDTVFDYGMVLSCEPGLYIPQEQIGIRIETVMLVNDKPIDLMPQVPLSVEEIEFAMQSSC